MAKAYGLKMLKMNKN